MNMKILSKLYKTIRASWNKAKQFNLPISNRVEFMIYLALFAFSFLLFLLLRANNPVANKIVLILEIGICVTLFRFRKKLYSINKSLVNNLSLKTILKNILVKIKKKKFFKPALCIILILTLTPIINNYCFAWGTPPSIIFLLTLLIGLSIVLPNDSNNKNNRRLLATVGLIATLITYAASLGPRKAHLLITLISGRKITYKGLIKKEDINIQKDIDIAIIPVTTEDIDLFDDGYYNLDRYGCIIKDSDPFKIHKNKLSALEIEEDWVSTKEDFIKLINTLMHKIDELNYPYRRGNLFYTAKQYYFAVQEYEKAKEGLKSLSNLSNQLKNYHIKDYNNYPPEDYYLTQYSSRLYLNLGLSYYSLDINNKAETYLQMSLDSITQYLNARTDKQPNLDLFAAADSNLAILYAERKQYDRAYNLLRIGLNNQYDGNRINALRQIQHMSENEGGIPKILLFYYYYYKNLLNKV